MSLVIQQNACRGERQMEHRRSTRHEFELTVGVYYRGSWIGTCQTRDISTGGMFLRTKQESLKKNALIEVTFDRPGSAGVKRYRLPSLVVHGADGGVGIMFRSPNTEAHAALQQLLARETQCYRISNCAAYP